MKFTDKQIDLLFLRLRQTKEELLYDSKLGEVEPYKLCQRDGDILGVAHCDFVESAWSYPEFMNAEKTKVRAGQVDDRVGVWLLLDVLPEVKGMPKFDYLLTTDEEVGNSTAQDVKEPLHYNWAFQFDRRGVDFVDYGWANKAFLADFEQHSGITQGLGSFSDICWLPRSCGSRVNIGTAYYHEHSPDAFVNLEECASQVEKFVKFAKRCWGTPYAASPMKESRAGGYASRSKGYGSRWSGNDAWLGDSGAYKDKKPKGVSENAGIGGDDLDYNPKDLTEEELFEMEWNEHLEAEAAIEKLKSRV